MTPLEEIEVEDRKRQMLDADRKRDAERNMSYASLAGMLSFPLLIILSSALNLHDAAVLLSDIAGVSYIAVGAVLSAYFGFNTLSEIKGNANKT